MIACTGRSNCESNQLAKPEVLTAAIVSADAENPAWVRKRTASASLGAGEVGPALSLEPPPHAVSSRPVAAKGVLLSVGEDKPKEAVGSTDGAKASDGAWLHTAAAREGTVRGAQGWTGFIDVHVDMIT